MPTNTRESGLETLIVKWLVEQNGYEQGETADYNREYAVDESRLFRFLDETQTDQMAKLGIKNSDVKRIQFLDRLRGEIDNIIENYAQAIEEKDPETSKVSYKQIFPLYISSRLF